MSDDDVTTRLTATFAPLPSLGGEHGGARVFCGEGFVVVHKPAGVPGRKDERRDDDVVRRVASLGAFLKAQGVSSPAPLARRFYQHETLDKEVSGAVLFSVDKSLNGSLSSTFERGNYERTWQTWVSTTEPVAPFVSEDRLVSVSASGDTPAYMRLSRQGERGRDYRFRAEVLRQEGDLALLSLKTNHPRSHVIRAQLAERGLPVVGDVFYGGRTAPRVMLHGTGLALPHPSGEGRIHVQVEPDVTFSPRRERLSQLSDQALLARLQSAAVSRWGLFELRHEGEATTAFRWVHGAGDGLAEIAVDLYGEHVVLQLYERFEREDERRLCDVLMRAGARGVYLKRRPRQANTLADTRSEQLAPEGPVAGVSAASVPGLGDSRSEIVNEDAATDDAHEDALRVHESGVPFAVRLGDGLSTGIFLDQRENRLRLRRMAEGKRVLNLFAYTCPFTSAAVAGGATSTVSIDAAAPALTWGERNLALLDSERALRGSDVFLRGDVFDKLAQFAESGELFDIVVVDPPTYSSVKGSRWTSGKDWVRLTAACARVLRREGTLLATSNDRRMSIEPFKRFVAQGVAQGGRQAGRMHVFEPPLDFPPDPKAGAHLKTLVVPVFPEGARRDDHVPEHQRARRKPSGRGRRAPRRRRRR